MKKFKEYFNGWFSEQHTTQSSIIRCAPSCSAGSYLVSYPRSGSNFLQNVLEKSSGQVCGSLYGAVWSKRGHHLNVKSHAFSRVWLLDEINRYTKVSDNNPKVMCIFRDPRDVMISFWNFVQYKKNIVVAQDKFIDHMAYDYATFTSKDPVLDRRVEWSPLSVGDSYREHYRNWMLQDESKNFTKFKFEKLLTSPHLEFKRLFDFLGINCELAEEALAERVSLYGGDKGRKRGQQYGWKANYNKYKAIIDKVEQDYSDIIDGLGYTDI